MITKIKNGKLIIKNTVKENLNLYFKEDMIIEVTQNELPFDAEIDANGNYVSAGFVDIHTHGGGNSDFMDATNEAYFAAAAVHAVHGTTDIVPTTLSGSLSEMQKTFEVYKNVKNAEHRGAAFAGLHLEGPYFSYEQRGAQDPKYIKNPEKNEYDKILAMTDDIIRWSAAPELEGTEDFAKTLRSAGILPSVAHTDATYEQVLKAFDAGFTHITHLYSGMSTIHRINGYRFAGVVESAYLIDDMTVEIIADGCHLPPSLLQFVYKLKGPDKTALITDSMRAAGMDVSESILGSLKDGQKVLVEDGVAKLLDRSAFAGSVATMDRVARTMLKSTSATLPEVIKMASENPAKIVGLKNVGTLDKGHYADIIIFNDNIDIQRTIVRGKTVFEQNNPIATCR